MKPCLTKRKEIALLAGNSLENQQERELRAHLDSCPACRRYFEEISSIATKLRVAEPQVASQPGESFHRNLMGALAKTKRESLMHRIWTQVWTAWNWRWALPATATAALAIAAWFVVGPRAKVPVVAAAPVAVHQVAAPVAKGELEPTIANYEMAVRQSLDKLDELLTEQGNRNPQPSPTYTAAQLPRSNMAD
jgi:predicted anti-sigma-YlaC factor YlaD